MNNILDRFCLKGKAALITGAGRNLGRRFAEALAQAGADVCVADIDLKTAEQTAKEIAIAYDVKTIACAVDVSDPEQTRQCVAITREKLGRLDICVANAGIFQSASAEKMSIDMWNRIIDVNLSGAFFTVQAAANAMIEQGQGGVVVFITSISAHQASKSPSCAYSASKGALLTMVHDLANEWSKYQIRVNCISPGNMDTDILTPEWRIAYQKECEDETVMGRLGKQDELQGALIYLVSDAASYTTGAEIVVDGGYIIK